jgi:hypothetical protein
VDVEAVPGGRFETSRARLTPLGVPLSLAVPTFAPLLSVRSALAVDVLLAKAKPVSSSAKEEARMILLMVLVPLEREFPF